MLDMSLMWLNLTEPLRTTELQREHGSWVIFHGFWVVRLFQTSSNHSTTQGSRPEAKLDMSYGWFNFTEPLSHRGNNNHRINSHEFRVLRLFRTGSNHSTTHGSRPAVKLDMSSGWLNLTKPPPTTELQREQGSQGNFSLVRGGSTLPNLFEP